MATESYDMSELPGTYNYDGFLMNVTIPKTKERIKVKVPAQHIAYNIVLPKICKTIYRKNFREMIKDGITGVKLDPKIEFSVCHDRRDSVFCEDEVYGFSRKLLIKDTGKLSEFVEDICAETGHALSGDRYGIPELHELHEFYDFVAQKIGSEELKNSSFSFEPESEVEYISTCFHELKEKLSTNFYCIRNLRNSFEQAAEKPSYKTLMKLKEKYEDAIIARHNFGKAMEIYANQNVRNHIRGYAMGEIIYENIGNECFVHHDLLFMQRDRKAFPKPIVEKKLSKNDRKLMKSTLSKIEYIERISDIGYPKTHEYLQRRVGEFLENSNIEIDERYKIYEPIRKY